MKNAMRGGVLTWASVFGALYLLTALIGVWAAYDRAVAWERFSLIALSVLLVFVLAWAGVLWRSGDQALVLLGLGFALVAAALASYFLLTYDWRQQATIKFPLLYDLGIWIQNHRPALPVPEDINANVAASGLALLLPLGVGGSLSALRHKRLRWAAVLTLPAALLAVFALVITMSRGAWLGLSAGFLLAAYAWWRTNPQKSGNHWRRRDDLLVVAAVLALLGVFFAALLAPQFGQLLASVGFWAASGSRVALWRDALVMIGDYPFTGSGLGATMMVHASYIMLIHVGFIRQMHNLFLEVAVQQGIPGMLALLGLVAMAAMALRERLILQKRSILLFAAIVSLTALVVHGMFDAAVYGSRMAPLTLLPIGFALGLAPNRVGVDRPVRKSRRSLLFAGLLLVALVLLLTSTARSTFLANLGTVRQTQAELSVYTWPDWGIQDAVRRSPDIDLAPALGYYHSALALNPANVAANRRLGQIELSLGEYANARTHLQRAYTHAPWQPANRFLLGESHAIAGEINQAAELWSTITAKLWWEEDWIGPQAFRIRQWRYDSIGETQQAAWIGEVIGRVSTDNNQQSTINGQQEE